jgi:hypothetical protein
LYSHPRFAEAVTEYMVRLHWVIRASVPLMEAACDRARLLADTDYVAAGLAAYLAQHVREEQNHDEWLLDDLALLGLSRNEVLSRMPSPAIAGIVGAQYYWIMHHHPVALLGYIAVLEGSPPTVDEIDALADRTGLPRAAFNTSYKHAHLDPHHRDDLDRTLDTLPLQPEHVALIGVSALMTHGLLGNALVDGLAPA